MHAWELRCIQCFATIDCITYGLQSARFLCPWVSPGKNIEVGCYFLLLGVFLTQGSNQHLLHWHAGSLPFSHLRSPIYTK